MKRNNKQTTGTRTQGQLPFPASRWRKLINRITGCQYQYQITLAYYYERDEDGYWVDSKFLKRTIQIGIEDPAVLDFNHRRDLHKDLFPNFIKSIDKKYLKNGSPRIENIYYLGYFK